MATYNQPQDISPTATYMQFGSSLMSSIAQAQTGAAQLSAIYFNKYQAELDAQSLQFANKVSNEAMDRDYKNNVEKLTKDARQIEGSQKAALAANGIDLSSVSAQDIINDTFNKLSQDVNALNRTRLNQQAAANYNTGMQVSALKAKASLLGRQAKSQYTSNILGALNSGFQTAYSAFNAYSTTQALFQNNNSLDLSNPTQASIYNTMYNSSNPYSPSSTSAFMPTAAKPAGFK
jgi:hypothetical protein